MKKAYIPIFTGILALLLPACSGEKTGAGAPAGQDGEIRLNGEPTTVSMGEGGTRVAPGFPNDGKIGVIAGLYDENGIDWTSYPDISNTSATAMYLVSGTYYFEWDTDPVKYWPFDGEQLVFMAYSPPASENNMLLATTNNSLNLSLDDDMPDVLYASANTTAAKTPYSKLSPAPVSLGQFRHALSQVTVEVMVENGINDIVLTHLSLKTLRRNAVLLLPMGDDGLTVVDEESPHEYVFVSDNTTVAAGNTFSRNVYLFPGTEDYTSVSIGLLGPGGDPFERTYPMFFFQSNDPLHLERAKRTTLRIFIKANTVPDPTPVIDLKGVLSEWDQRGNFGMTIN